MQEEGLDVAVVGGHHAEALKEGVAVMLRGVATLLEISQDGIGIHHGQSLTVGLLHDADAPVDISRRNPFHDDAVEQPVALTQLQKLDIPAEMIFDENSLREYPNGLQVKVWEIHFLKFFDG